MSKTNLKRAEKAGEMTQQLIVLAVLTRNHSS